jgi:hypothetical protein
MLFTSSLLVAALVGAAQAQTPKGFTPAVTKQLDVLYNGTAVNTPGELLSKAGKSFSTITSATEPNTNTDQQPHPHLNSLSPTNSLPTPSPGIQHSCS